MQTVIVIASFNASTERITAFSGATGSNGARLLVAGDKKSSDIFKLQYLDLKDVVVQKSAFPGLADEDPYYSYPLKHVG